MKNKKIIEEYYLNLFLIGFGCFLFIFGTLGHETKVSFTLINYVRATSMGIGAMVASLGFARYLYHRKKKMKKIKKNVIVGNLDAESRKVLNEMGIDDEFNLSESFSEYLEENNICLNEKKVEIWKFLKEMKTVLNYVIIVFLWITMIITIIFCWGMANNINRFIDFFVGKPFYLKVMANMILIPITVCLVSWIINICIVLYMRFIVNKMDESEMAKARIISSMKTSKKEK